MALQWRAFGILTLAVVLAAAPCALCESDDGAVNDVANDFIRIETAIKDLPAAAKEEANAAIIQLVKDSMKLAHGQAAGNATDVSGAGYAGSRSGTRGGKCDKCNIPVNQGGCKCNNNCDCINGAPTPNKCDKCNIPVNQGGCKCNSNCDCIGSTPAPNKCDKCNLPENQGGCKCNSNCDCIGGGNPNPPNGGNVILSGTASGTYYYDLRNSCPQDHAGYAENNGYPACTSWTPGPNQQTLAQMGSNNVIAIDANLLQGNRGLYCGKKVVVTYNGQRVSAPDGGDFFVWDGCAACIGGGRIDFSVSGARRVNGNACTLGVIPGVQYQITNEQVRQFVN